MQLPHLLLLLLLFVLNEKDDERVFSNWFHQLLEAKFELRLKESGLKIFSSAYNRSKLFTIKYNNFGRNFHPTISVTKVL